MLLVLLMFVIDSMSSSLVTDADVFDLIGANLGELACLCTSGSGMANLSLILGFNESFFSTLTSTSSLLILVLVSDLIRDKLRIIPAMFASTTLTDQQSALLSRILSCIIVSLTYKPSSRKSITSLGRIASE